MIFTRKKRNDFFVSNRKNGVLSMQYDEINIGRRDYMRKNCRDWFGTRRSVRRISSA